MKTGKKCGEVTTWLERIASIVPVSIACGGLAPPSDRAMLGTQCIRGRHLHGACPRVDYRGDHLALQRTLNDEEALRWIRRNPDLFRLIRVTDQLVA